MVRLNAIEDMCQLVIIPDVHGRTFWKEAVERFPMADFVFLGDYLDPYNDEGIPGEQAYEGLLEIVDFKKTHPEKVTLLFGNHDLHYLFSFLKGSRFDEEHARRNADIFRQNIRLFQMAYEVQVNGRRYLFSHAGVGRMWIDLYAPALEPDEITADWLNLCMKSDDFYAALGHVSWARGGFLEFGSMIWADLSEQKIVENQLPAVQVFGHTCVKQPFNWENRVYCLDCGSYFVLNLTTGRIYDRDDREVKAFPFPKPDN